MQVVDEEEDERKCQDGNFGEETEKEENKVPEGSPQENILDIRSNDPAEPFIIDNHPGERESPEPDQPGVSPDQIVEEQDDLPGGVVVDMAHEFKDGHLGCSREEIVAYLVGEGVSRAKSEYAVDFAAKEVMAGEFSLEPIPPAREVDALVADHPRLGFGVKV